MIGISTPEYSLLVYLCQFTVRSLKNLLEVFLVSVKSIEYIPLLEKYTPVTPQINNLTDLPIRSILVLSLTSIRQINLSSCVTPSLKRF